MNPKRAVGYIPQPPSRKNVDHIDFFSFLRAGTRCTKGKEPVHEKGSNPPGNSPETRNGQGCNRRVRAERKPQGWGCQRAWIVDQINELIVGAGVTDW